MHSRPLRTISLPTARTGGAYGGAIGGMTALAASLGIGRFVYTPILPAMTAALGLGNAEAGLIASANFVGYLVGALVAASPRLGGSRRAWLLGSLLVSALTTAGMGLADTLPAFLIIGPGVAGITSEWSGGFALPSAGAAAALVIAALLALRRWS